MLLHGCVAYACGRGDESRSSIRAQLRPDHDDFLPPPSGPRPVTFDKAHPYVPNGQGQSTYRVADLTNPILKPWAVEQMRKANDAVLAGKIPFIARERCWPAGVPAIDIYNRGQPVHFIQTPKMVVIINELYPQIRHVYLNVPPSAHVKPSWYGESVGHYEGDELVVDTIGLNERTFVDNYRTPHTEQLHVVERFKMVDGGNTLQVFITVDDPGAFNMPWSAMQHWQRINRGPLIEDVCEPNTEHYFGYDVAPLPHAGFLSVLPRRIPRHQGRRCRDGAFKSPGCSRPAWDIPGA